MSANHLQNRNFGLDLMRAIAIILVLLHHWTGSNLSKIPAFQSNIQYMSLFGFLGVEIFFVLSGFLIGNIIVKSYCNESQYGRKSIINFWGRRWLRTLPLYYFILLIYIVTSIAIKHYMFPGVWKYFLFLQNIFAYDKTNHDFFGTSWSLSIEEWFYLSFPIFLLTANLFLKKVFDKKVIILSVILCYIIVSLLIRTIYVYIGDPSWNDVLRKAVVCREDSIAFGVLGALFHNFRNERFNKFKGSYFLVGFVFFVLCITIFIKDISYNYFYNVGHVSFFSKTALFSLVSFSVLLMLPYCYNLKCNNSALKITITHISKISYSLYLVHLFVNHIVHGVLPNNQSFLVLFLKLILFLLLSVIVSTITFNLIENYFLRLRDKIWKEKYNAT